MKRVVVVALLLGVVTAAAAAADSWQYEAALQGYSASSDSGDSHSVAAVARYYYAPLPVEGDYPLAEAIYNERIGYVEGSYQRYDLDGSDISADGNFYQLGTIYMQPGSNFAASLYLGKADARSQLLSGGVQATADTQTYSAGVGYFLQANLLANISYRQEKTDAAYNPMLFPPFTLKAHTAELALRYWRQMGENYLVVVPRYDYITRESDFYPDQTNQAEGVRGIFYWSKYQDVWLSYAANQGDDAMSAGKSYSAGYDIFLSRSVYLNLSYDFARADACMGDCITRSWMAAAGMRF